MSQPELSELETRIMQVLWSRDACSAEDVRFALAGEHELTDSSIRTLLRRLEAKGYVAHDLDGKRFLYRATTQRRNVAAAAARRIIEKICGGEADSLLIGMIEDEVISPEELDKVRRMLADSRKRGKRGG